jgi:DNA-binding NarL/FixJ family response regulator
VLLVDDHKILREGLVRLISHQMDIQVVGEASCGFQAIELSRQLNPDLILMDISMPDMDGIKATRIIKREMPHIQVIGLSMFEDEVTPTMLDSGAAGFISKTASTSELLRTIYTFAKKKKTIMPDGWNAFKEKGVSFQCSGRRSNSLEPLLKPPGITCNLEK